MLGDILLWWGQQFPNANYDNLIQTTIVAVQVLTTFLLYTTFQTSARTLKRTIEHNERTIEHNDLTALDDFYRHLVTERLRSPKLGDLHLDGDGGVDDKARIEYAYLMITFVETIMSRGLTNERVQNTWQPLVEVELKRYFPFLSGTMYLGCFSEDAILFFKSGGFTKEFRNKTKRR